GFTPRQTPPLQVSPVVHGSASSHAAVFGTCTQPSAASQRSSVQGSWSSQLCAVQHAVTLTSSIASPGNVLLVLLAKWNASRPSPPANASRLRVSVPQPALSSTVVGGSPTPDSRMTPSSKRNRFTGSAPDAVRASTEKKSASGPPAPPSTWKRCAQLTRIGA